MSTPPFANAYVDNAPVKFTKLVVALVVLPIALLSILVLSLAWWTKEGAVWVWGKVTR